MATVPKSTSFVDREIARNIRFIHKLTAKDSTGRWAVYFIYVQGPKEKLFLEAIKRPETIDLEAYGRVLASCYGEKPDDDVMAVMRDRFGYIF